MKAATVRAAPTDDLDRIPDELKDRPQWACWRARPKPGKPGKIDKVPVDPKTGKDASSTDPTTWGTFAEARAALRGWPDLRGVGFMLSVDDPYVGIDLDGCHTPETGTIAPWAMAIVERFGSLAEFSQSLTGIHLLIRGTKPGDRCRTGRIEVYEHARFFVVTGDVLPGYETIRDGQGTLGAWYAETFPPKPAPAAIAPSPLAVDDRDLLTRCEDSEKFRRLFAGNLNDYRGDHSSADLGFLDVIVRNGGTPEQADRLLRSSGLMREKWERTDYRDRTLDRAFDGTVRPWEPKRQPTGPNHQVDGSVVIPDDPADLERLVAELAARVEFLERDRAEEKRLRLAAEARAEHLSRLHSKTMQAFRSKTLGAEKLTAIALATELAVQQAREPTRTAFVIPHARLAERAGVAEGTVANHLAKLDRLGMYEREKRFTPTGGVIPETGEILEEPRTQTLYVPKIDPLEMLDRIALAPPDPEKGAKNGHGGVRHRVCPDHPHAGVVKRTAYHCGTCDRLLDKEKDVSLTAVPNHQVDGFVADPADGPHPPSVATSTRAAKQTDYHNVKRSTFNNGDPPAPSLRPTPPIHAAIPGGMADSWQRAQAPPPDRYTEGGP